MRAATFPCCVAVMGLWFVLCCCGSPMFDCELIQKKLCPCLSDKLYYELMWAVFLCVCVVPTCVVLCV